MIKAATALFVLLAVLLLAAGLLGPWGSRQTGDSAADARTSSTPAETGSFAGEDDQTPLPAGTQRTVNHRTGGPVVGSSGAGDIAVKLASFKNAREREACINGLVRSYAALDPLAAMEKIRELPDADTRDMAMLALYGEWSGMSAADIIRSGDAGHFGIAGALGLYLMNNGRMTPEQTAALANEFLSGDAQVGVLGRAAEKMAATDPAAALALGEKLDGRQQTRFLARFAMGWAQADPEAARQWASQIGDPSTRARVIERILEAEVSDDPALAARSFLETPPDTPPARARAAGRIAAEWAGKDTLAAMQWAAGLTNEADRTAAQRGIERVAPIGIGAMLNSGADGVPVVGGIVPGTPASGSLRVGDRVLSVSGADGAWVNARNVSMGEVISLIRGQPNTQVSLQVQSPGDQAPRVITIGRQQIIHRTP